MNDEFLQKRIIETKHEIFPLDRLLSLESIYLIFQQEYSKSEDKNLFFKDPKYQRLLGLPSDTEEDYAISDVTIIDKDGIVYQKTINLNDWIDKNEVPMVYQDKIRFK